MFYRVLCIACVVAIVSFNACFRLHRPIMLGILLCLLRCFRFLVSHLSTACIVEPRGAVDVSTGIHGGVLVGLVGSGRMGYSELWGRCCVVSGPQPVLGHTLCAIYYAAQHRLGHATCDGVQHAIYIEFGMPWDTFGAMCHDVHYGSYFTAVGLFMGW